MIKRTTQDWQKILEIQREAGQKDEDCAQAHGVSISQLKRWRTKVGGRRKGPSGAFIEVQLPSPREDLLVTLKNGITLLVPIGWSVDQVAKIARVLGVL